MENTSTHPGDLFMLCHPHNPVGTAFTKEELERFSKWALQRELVICSDEIHCDLLLDPELRHIPLGNLEPETAEHTITLMAPSKTYNLPGFGCSFAIISNADLRVRFKKAMAGIVPDPAAMGFHLAEAAYRDSEEWRQCLLAYLRNNRDYALSKLLTMPGLTPYSPSATYLLWIDARKLGTDDPHRFFEENGVGLSDGSDFGAPGFLRLNLGCSRKIIEEALNRMERGVLKPESGVSMSKSDKEKSQRLEELRAEIKRHNELYYRQAQPEISDQAYDQKKRELDNLQA